VIKVEVYARVRRAVQVDGMSMREAAREFGLARKTIRKMLAYSVPPGYERKKPVKRKKCSCRWCIRQETHKWTSARRWW